MTSFLHQDSDFGTLIRRAAAARGVERGFVEKDYWITHTLWALQHRGFDVWFKGGTSLSKGFGLITRFSEDLDLKVEPGRVHGIKKVENWSSEKPNPSAVRREFFTRLAKTIEVPGAEVLLRLGPELQKRARSGEIEVSYPGLFTAELPSTIRPFILLEVGDARVTPSMECPITSWLHEDVGRGGEAVPGFVDNRVAAIRCVHPLVTMLEKLESIERQFGQATKDPARFVRHYEDVGHLAAAGAAGKLPPLRGYASPRQLAETMLAEADLGALPDPRAEAFHPNDGPRWAAIRAAYDAQAPIHWGRRMSLTEACSKAATWMNLALLLGRTPRGRGH